MPCLCRHCKTTHYSGLCMNKYQHLLVTTHQLASDRAAAKPQLRSVIAHSFTEQYLFLPHALRVWITSDAGIGCASLLYLVVCLQAHYAGGSIRATCTVRTSARDDRGGAVLLCTRRESPHSLHAQSNRLVRLKSKLTLPRLLSSIFASNS